MNADNPPFAFERATFFYEPYPIGIIREVFDSQYHDELLKMFPPLDLFRFMQYHGDKYSLSEVNNPDKYFAFIERTPSWRRLYEYVKSERFIPDVLDVLVRNDIDLGIPKSSLAFGSSSVRQKLRQRLLRALGARNDGLKSRFEFSAMPARGGHILPHTDSPQKIITLVVSMREAGGWESSFGGGTEVMRPTDPSKNFNLKNRYLTFDEVETVREMPFDSNQCVIFVKTFNSLHGVRPMTGPPDVVRRTLTINIETGSA
jgi:hypothetical protein